MNRLSNADRVRILGCLVEGVSIRATCRLTGFSKVAVLRFLVEMGEVCQGFHDRNVRGLRTDRIQCDEVWAFCHAKDKNLPASMKNKPGVGSVWTWTALDKDTKIMASFHVGGRGADCAREFMLDLAGRVTNRIQLSTDGHSAYLGAVAEAFGHDVDYAMLTKQFREPRTKQSRYSPADCIGCTETRIIGRSITADVCTSHVERSNLSIRMGPRRYTRLTNAFSKKLENLKASMAIYAVHDNFAKVHGSIRCTPAMEAGIAKHLWGLEEIVGLLEATEQLEIENGSLKCGSYRPRMSA